MSRGGLWVFGYVVGVGRGVYDSGFECFCFRGVWRRFEIFFEYYREGCFSNFRFVRVLRLKLGIEII